MAVAEALTAPAASGARKTRRARPGARALALVFAAALGFMTASASAQTLVVLSDESAGYLTVADELRAGLRAVRGGGVRIDVVTARGLARVGAPELEASELVVTVGLAAARATLARAQDLARPPLTLSLLIPRQTFERLAGSRSDGPERRLSAVFIDQPLSRQLDLLRVALPEKRRVGVILGPSSRLLAQALDDRARERSLQLSVAEVKATSDVYAALRKVMPRSDLLLVLPDPVATSLDSVHGLLLTSYRAQVPVVGFSEGLAKAGALLSLFSSATQQGRQGAEIARRVLAGEGLPPPAYPRYFTVRVNTSVARSLGLELESEQLLTDAVGGRDGSRDEARAPRPDADGARPQERP